jgi:ribosomal protein S18 acetylase RimI-like enzyme
LELAMDARLRRAVEFLEHDPLRNIVLLKTLFYYPHAIQCRFNEGPTAAGVLLLLSGGASSFDRQNYPGTDHVVFIAATEPAVLPELLAHVPRGQRLLFKLMDPRHNTVVRRFFSLELINAFVSYTASPDKLYASAEGVTASGMPGEACLDLYAALGHSREELGTRFAKGQALSFTVYGNDTPLATCFTFPNYGKIYEIGGVYTDPGQRRRGLARKVVEAALHHLGQAGFGVRYQAREDNRASIRLAESIGLRHVVTYEHWRHEPAMKETV